MRAINLLLALLCPACASYSGPPPNTPQPAPVTTPYTLHTDLTYTPAQWPQTLLADVYVPQGKGPFPAVLVIHGGGWESGDRNQVKSIAERVAARGYVVMNVTYRIAPAYRFPAPVYDLQQALQWLRFHAADYKVDGRHVGAFGYSAGAHLAAMLGTISKNDPLDKPYGGPLTRVQAVVAGGTPTDLRKFPGGDLVPQFLDTTLQQRPDLYALASPITHITPSTAPFFLYHGGMDMLVPVDHAIDMKAALDGAGVPAELYILRGREHVTAFLTDWGAVDAAIDFLDRYLR
jgi:acetyl esterase/lipase